MVRTILNVDRLSDKSIVLDHTKNLLMSACNFRQSSIEHTRINI